MAITDNWFFAGSQGFNNGILRAPYRMAINLQEPQGGGNTQQGLYTGYLTPKLNSSYSGTVIPATIGSNFARTLPWSHAVSDSADRKFIAGKFLKSSAGGSDYPVTDTPAEGTFTAYSLRAFMRLDGSANSTAGSFIALTAKARVTDDGTTTTANSYQGANNGNPQMFPGHHWSGYNVQLTTTEELGNNGALNTAPVIRFVAPKEGDNDNTTNNHYYTEDYTTGMAFNTWYHVRMDVVPYLAKDVVKVYTAPVTGAGSAAVAGIGSETWTEIISVDIASTEEYYYPWGGNSNHYNWVGVTTGARTYGAGANAAPDVSIDRFQFLTKDVSS